jgi:hypothetical protein
MRSRRPGDGELSFHHVEVPAPSGRGSKGERWCGWALVETTGPTAGQGGHHWLLIRRNRKTGEHAFYRAYSPPACPRKR